MTKHIAIAVISTVAFGALAPTDIAAAPAADLEEVVVTARKREERLQDVPVSVSVVSGEDLLADNIRNLESLSAIVPTFQYAESISGNDQVFIRGLGSGVNFGFENTVGQVFNGFYLGRARFGRASFMDVDQVEILKGPQGAIIGKNTTGGSKHNKSTIRSSELKSWDESDWYREL
ncbi:MAG: TonB-dependent receptor plug domain-containing protein, partial [Gammaproteobacteria bacterium]